MTTVPTRFRQLLPAAVFAAVFAFGSSALGYPAIATAQPRVWDIGDYDDCLEQARADYQTGKITLQDLTEADHICCVVTEGVWDADKGFCHAPPGDAHGWRRIPSDIATAPIVTREPPQPISPGHASGDSPAVTVAPAAYGH